MVWRQAAARRWDMRGLDAGIDRAAHRLCCTQLICRHMKWECCVQLCPGLSGLKTGHSAPNKPIQTYVVFAASNGRTRNRC
eukprot:4608907-Karenia_brevis.AAC.1